MLGNCACSCQLSCFSRVDASLFESIPCGHPPATLLMTLLVPIHGIPLALLIPMQAIEPPLIQMLSRLLEQSTPISSSLKVALPTKLKLQKQKLQSSG